MDLVVPVQLLAYGLTAGMGYGVFAIGLTLIFGVMGTLNIAHGELYMLGALILCSLTAYLGINYLVAALASIALLGIIGIIISRVVIEPLLDTPNPLLTGMLATIGVSIVLTNTAVAIWGVSVVPLQFPLEGGLQLGACYLAWERIILSIAAAAIFGLFYLFLARTRMGKNIRAISQSRIGASLVGINLRREYALTFSLGSALAALAGILIAPIWLANAYVGQYMLLKGFIVVIVGGLGSIRGAIVVGLFLGLSEAIFGYFVSVYYRDALSYGLMIIVLLLRPRGIFGK